VVNRGREVPAPTVVRNATKSKSETRLRRTDEPACRGLSYFDRLMETPNPGVETPLEDSETKGLCENEPAQPQGSVSFRVFASVITTGRKGERLGATSSGVG
jgi:hypothetical protein